MVSVYRGILIGRPWLLAARIREWRRGGAADAAPPLRGV